MKQLVAWTGIALRIAGVLLFAALAYQLISPAFSPSDLPSCSLNDAPCR